MKLSYNIIASVALALSFSSCLNEDWLNGQGKESGTLQLSVDTKNPVPTRSESTVPTENFPVSIYGEGVEVKSYAALSEVPNSIQLPVGTYIVKSHTPGDCPEKSYAPYYAGEDEVVIRQGEKTKSDVVCTMKNSIIQFDLSDEFKETFSSWTITVDDGQNHAVSSVWNGTNPEDGLNPELVYVLLGEDVSTLSIQYEAVTKSDGNVVNGSYIVRKSMASSGYGDGDDENFGGGDSVVLRFSAVASSNGQVTGVTISGHVTFTETGSDHVLDVVDADKEQEVNPESTAIKLGLPQPITLTDDTDPSLGDVKIDCENGVKSVMVKVTSSSDEMMEQLVAVADGYDGVDLVNGCEVVDNNNLVEFLAMLGQTITVPAVGDKSYTFPIGNFFVLLGILPGEHNFSLTVVDANGNTQNGVVTVTVPEN